MSPNVPLCLSANIDNKNKKKIRVSLTTAKLPKFTFIPVCDQTLASDCTGGEEREFNYFTLEDIFFFFFCISLFIRH